MANDGTVKIGVEVDEKEFKSGLSKLGSIAKAGLGATTAAIGAATAAATAGTVALGKLAQSAVSAYSDYEQLAGGVETLFKTSSATVMQYANNAYKTAGLSANEYMDTVTSFSASLLQGLGGDTEAAAQIADKAITDMADNANKMGTDMASIQYAYQGFAKQNYTMLDNLKLGYGGTQAKMARLINDSGVLGDTMQVTAQTVNQVSFDKIIEAIHVVQERMGIAGTTAKEASETIQGSVNAMKGAWQNFITGMADGDQDIGQLTENLVDSVLTVADNLVPRLQELLPRLAEGLAQLAANLLPYIPPTLETLLPALIDGSTAIFAALASTFPALISTAMSALPSMVDAAMEILAALGTGIMDSLPELLEAGVKIIVYLAEAITDALPELIPAIVEAITTIAETLTEPENLSLLITAALAIIVALAEGLIKAIPTLVKSLPVIIKNIVETLVSYDWLNIGKTIITGLGNGIKSMANFARESAGNIKDVVLKKIKELPSALLKVGEDMIKKLWEGISGMGEWLRGKIGGFISNAISAVTGGGSKSSSFSGGSSSPRSSPASAPAPRMDAPANESGGNGEEGISLEASSFSRASAVRALESAIPAAQSRVSAATAAMAPAGGTSYENYPVSKASMAEAFKDAMNGMEVTMDGRTVGRVVTKQQNNIGRAFGTA